MASVRCDRYRYKQFTIPRKRRSSSRLCDLVPHERDVVRTSRCLSWSSSVFPCIITSSATQMTPARPSETFSSFFEKISDEAEVPNGSRRPPLFKQFLVFRYTRIKCKEA